MVNTWEISYNFSEKEVRNLLVHATKYFRAYLLGREFTEITDHLRWLLSLEDPNSQLTRWSLKLSGFEMDIIHKKGKLHSNADGLSAHINKKYEEETNAVIKWNYICLITLLWINVFP